MLPSSATTGFSTSSWEIEQQSSAGSFVKCLTSESVFVRQQNSKVAELLLKAFVQFPCYFFRWCKFFFAAPSFWSALVPEWLPQHHPETLLKLASYHSTPLIVLARTPQNRSAWCQPYFDLVHVGLRYRSNPSKWNTNNHIILHHDSSLVAYSHFNSCIVCASLSSGRGAVTALLGLTTINIITFKITKDICNGSCPTSITTLAAGTSQIVAMSLMRMPFLPCSQRLGLENEHKKTLDLPSNSSMYMMGGATETCSRNI